MPSYSDLTPRQREQIADAVREALATELDHVMLKTVSGILTAFGMNEDERHEIRADFAYLRRWRKTSETVSRGGWVAISTVIVSGMASAVWLGIKAAFSLGGHG